MIRIDLEQAEGDEERLFLIVEKPGLGIVYRTQADAESCAQPEAEGYLMPLHLYGMNQGRGKELMDFFYWLKGEDVVSRLATLVNRIKYSVPDGVSERYTVSRQLELDVERLKQSGRPPMEAWLPVIAPPYGKGWLTWGNSD